MLLTGFAGIGFMGYRRSRKSTLAFAGSLIKTQIANTKACCSQQARLSS
jgi:hypothetical protein